MSDYPPLPPLTPEESAAFERQWQAWEAEVKRVPTWWQRVLGWLALRACDALIVASAVVALYLGAVLVGHLALMGGILVLACLLWCSTVGVVLGIGAVVRWWRGK